MEMGAERQGSYVKLKGLLPFFSSDINLICLSAVVYFQNYHRF